MQAKMYLFYMLIKTIISIIFFFLSYSLVFGNNENIAEKIYLKHNLLIIDNKRITKKFIKSKILDIERKNNFSTFDFDKFYVSFKRVANNKDFKKHYDLIPFKNAKCHEMKNSVQKCKFKEYIFFENFYKNKILQKTIVFLGKDLYFEKNTSFQKIKDNNEKNFYMDLIVAILNKNSSRKFQFYHSGSYIMLILDYD